MQERDTDISSNLAIIKIHVSGKIPNACTNTSFIPERTWSRDENVCQTQPLTQAQLIDNKKLATQHKQNVKITKKQQYANIANKRLMKTNIKTCPNIRFI